MKNNKIVAIITFLILVIIVIGIVYFINIQNNNSGGNTINKYSKVEDIVFEKNKVNIYMFWGDGCSNCEAQFEFLDSISKEYGKYYNLYCFEIWHNKDNKQLMNELAKEMNYNASGVPFTIIGEKYFIGFSEDLEDKFKEIIKEESTKSYDVYKKIK